MLFAVQTTQRASRRSSGRAASVPFPDEHSWRHVCRFRRHHVGHGTRFRPWSHGVCERVTNAALCVYRPSFPVLRSGWFGAGVCRQSPAPLRRRPADVDSARHLVCYQAATEFNTGIHAGESLPTYIWNTLILGNHEMGLISQWVVTAPFVTAVAFSIGAWLAVRRPQPA